MNEEKRKTRWKCAPQITSPTLHRYGSSGLEKKGYKPDVKLEYVDDNGRAMTQKEVSLHTHPSHTTQQTFTTPHPPPHPRSDHGRKRYPHPTPWTGLFATTPSTYLLLFVCSGFPLLVAQISWQGAGKNENRETRQKDPGRSGEWANVMGRFLDPLVPRSLDP